MKIARLQDERDQARLAADLRAGRQSSSATRTKPPFVAKYRKETEMTEEQIDKIVDRFLSWPLPKDFCPDCGITFKKKVSHADGEIDRYDAGPGWWPVGTNLFTADQAREMVKHMLNSTENENRSPSGTTD